MKLLEICAVRPCPTLDRAPEHRSAPIGEVSGLRILLAVAMYPIVKVLELVEPLVRWVLYGFAVLGLLSAALLYFTGHHQVRLWAVFVTSIGCVVAVSLYRVLYRLLFHIGFPGR